MIKKLFKPAKKLCPLCLVWSNFEQADKDGLHCSDCGTMIPAMYEEGYSKYPPVMVSIIGFRGHGKTVYLSSLFHTLQYASLTNYWPDFFHQPINQDALDRVFGYADKLEIGKLPDTTSKVLPQPVMLWMNGVAKRWNCTLLCYDTTGEAFKKGSQVKEYAEFVKWAKTALFLVSLPDLKKEMNNLNIGMSSLLKTYALGMQNELGAKTKDQDLIVVYTKADEILLPDELRGLLLQATLNNLCDPDKYRKGMVQISDRLYKFTETELQAKDFLVAARNNFKSVTFSMVSALGTKPVDQTVAVKIRPRRILDPLLWVIEKSLNK